MWLDFDGKKTDSPGADDIAAGFRSINVADGWLGAQPILGGDSQG